MVDETSRAMGKNKATEANKAIVQRWVDEVWNQRNAAAIDDLTAPHYVLHYFSTGTTFDLQAYKALHPLFMAALPDLKIIIDDMVAEDDKVTARLLQTGTHRAELMGVPPSGKRVEQRALAIYRIENGKLVEGWAAENPWPMTLAAAAT